MRAGHPWGRWGKTGLCIRLNPSPHLRWKSMRSRFHLYALPLATRVSACELTTVGKMDVGGCKLTFWDLGGQVRIVSFQVTRMARSFEFFTPLLLCRSNAFDIG